MPTASPDPTLTDDALSRLLGDLRIDGLAYGHGRLARPWGIAFPHDGPARLHVIHEGEAWLQVEGSRPQKLSAGDAVFLPRGASHTLGGAPAGPTTCVSKLDVRAVAERVHTFDRHERPDAILSSCSVTFNEPCLQPLLQMMPATLAVTGREADPMMDTLLRAMADEVRTPKVGGATVLTRLADVVITRLVRAWVESEAAEGHGWLRALRDPRIGRALSALHQDPARAWSIDDLARIASLSRSLFAERFTLATGHPPGRYLGRLRMTLAARMLREQRLGIGTVAHRLGYQSAPAFSRAVKRHLGVSPGELRQAP